MLQPGAPVPDERIAEYVGLYYDFVRDDKVATLTAEYASATARRFVTMQGPFRDIMKWTNLPPAFVILQRINLGLYAILGRLRATANWRLIAEELWPMTDGPPSTDARPAGARLVDRTGGSSMDFEVRRDDLRTTRSVDDGTPSLDDGQALLRVSRFALTANNVTYAVVGEAMSYWTFFPDRGGLGSCSGVGLRRRRGVAR